MFCFERKIYYIDLYEKEERKGNAGFIAFTLREKEIQVHIGIRGMDKKRNIKCQWYGLKNEETILLDEIRVRDGQADFYKEYPMANLSTGHAVSVCDRQNDAERGKLTGQEFAGMKGFYFQFDKNCWGNCFIKKEEEKIVFPQVQAAEARPPRSTFEQLLQTYPVVQPFESQGDYVEIEPMTLKVLAPGYRKLADNSFILHGYYTHNHIILGFYKDEERQGYYLGVPGSFETKEQLMAEMFGFEGYERSGDLGYYMRKVEF